MTYFKSQLEMVHQVNQWCSTNIEKFSAESLFLPAGKTPEAVYQNWEQQKPHWLEKLELLQVDDVYSGKNKGMFQKFFQDHLPSYSQRVLTPAQSGGRSADLAILGLGRNGHVGFHEPGLPESFFYGVIDLCEETKSHLNLEKDAKGVTYGVGAFLQAKAVLLIVTGPGKEEVFERFQGEDTSLPVSYLKKHPELTILVDEASIKAQSLSGAEKAIFAAPNRPASSGI